VNLYLKNFCKDYHVKKVLKAVDGKINAQDKIGLIGANGVGKTTLVAS